MLRAAARPGAKRAAPRLQRLALVGGGGKGVHAYGVGGYHGMIGATARTAGANKHSAGEGEGCDTR